MNARAANGSLSLGARVSVLVSSRGIGAGDRADVERVGQEVDDRVEQGLDALVLERGAAQDRVELGGERRAADGRLQQLGGDLRAVEVGLGELVVAVGQRLDHLGAGSSSDVDEVGGDLFDRVVLTDRGLAAPHEGAVADQVDDADEVALGADRHLQHEGRRAEALTDRLDAEVEACTGAVELVDEAHARDAVLVGLTPHRLGLRLDTGDTVEHGDRTVEDAQVALDLDGEVDVPGGVDDVDLVVFPPAGRRSRRDRDATLLLLLHPVHRGAAIVDFTDLVRDTGVEEDAFGRRGLAGIDVRHDADVADPV